MQIKCKNLVETRFIASLFYFNKDNIFSICSPNPIV